jgi:hypothetical protein
MEQNEHSKDSSLQESLKPHSLRASGWAYIVGDAALFASGWLGGRKKEAATGLLYAAGGLTLARYGNPSAERRFKMLCSDLGKYLQSQGVEIPKGCHVDSATLAREGGVIDRIEEFLYTHPSEVLNTLFAVGGGVLVRSGMQHDKPWDTASGALTAAGALAGLLIPEKHASEEEKKSRGFAGKVLAWAQEHPLGISGALYMANNATLTVSALKERRANPGNNAYLFKLLTAASYIVANGLLAISSKENMSPQHSPERTKALDRLEIAAAEIIAAQKPLVQEKLIEQVSGFLSSRPGVNIPAKELAVAMREKIAAMPQATVAAWRQKMQPSISEGLSPSV